jgi:hypothetical protein
MNFWWVNHKQTFRSEIGEGYIWSPKVKKDGHFSQAYHNMTFVRPYDVIFSYALGNIIAVGIIVSTAIESNRPTEFGKIGEQWSNNGWIVKVQWEKLLERFSPKENIALIAPLLPSKHSPIQRTGDGNQGQYLASISSHLGELLLRIIEQTNPLLRIDLAELKGNIQEDEIVYSLQQKSIAPTFKEQLIKARIGQGRFRMEVEDIEFACRMTGLSDKRFLIASHIKPWKDSEDFEKLDGHNGLLLSPHVDKLFDNKHITFSEDGNIIVPNPKVLLVMEKWKLNPNKSVGKFTDKQQKYLAYHRELTLSRSA